MCKKCNDCLEYIYRPYITVKGRKVYVGVNFGEVDLAGMVISIVM